MITHSSSPGLSGADSYTDLSSVNAIRSIKDKNLALEKIAQQFESMMVRMMMKSMRAANESFAEGNFLSSSEGDTYQDMYDDQLALTLSQGRGMGLAEVMMRQLQGSYGQSQKSSAAEKTSGNSIAAYVDRPQPEAAFVARPQQEAIIRSALAAGEVNGLSHERASSIAATAAQSSQRSAQPKGKPLELGEGVKDFIIALYPMAEQAAKKLGVDVDVLIAQAALETGWGDKMSQDAGDRSSLNLFNIKADDRWQGDRVQVDTLEVRDGMPVKEKAFFRAYDSLAASVDDYVDFVANSTRYQGALQAGGGENYIRELGRAGYATDPRYADKVLQIANSDTMQAALAVASHQPAVR